MALFIDNQEVLNLSMDGVAIDNVNIDGVTVAEKPIITTQPVGGTINDDASITLSCVAEGLGSTMTYQWYKGEDDSAIEGATSDSYTFTPSTTGSFSFYCSVKGFGGYTKTDAASVVVEASGTTHQWTIGTGDMLVSFYYHGFIDNRPTGAPQIGEFTPRLTATGTDCLLLGGDENKGSGSSESLFAVSGNVQSTVTLDIEDYGVISGPLVYDSDENISGLIIWEYLPSEGINEGVSNGEGLQDFMKANIGNIKTVRITIE